jgi:hypothetical protein
MTGLLSGRWIGVYRYPGGDANPVEEFTDTPLSITLEDNEGAVIGSCEEPDLPPPMGGTDLVHCRIEGEHSRGRIRFTKTPLNHPTLRPVVYEGEISRDGRRITGRWDLPDTWSGTFDLLRQDP